MKKIIAVILIFVYISTTTGANIHIHYCMGKIADWEFGRSEPKTCGECGMEKIDEQTKGCCKDEYKFIKNDNDQKFSETGFQMVQLAFIAIPVQCYEILGNIIPTITEENPINHGPPLSNCIAIFILNRTFLI